VLQWFFYASQSKLGKSFHPGEAKNNCNQKGLKEMHYIYFKSIQHAASMKKKMQPASYEINTADLPVMS
jgi:hypothetical protein